MNLYEQLRARATHLTPAESRVGEWLQDHSRQAAAMTIAEVARAVGVSEPTVIRFCRSLGIGGFRELRGLLIGLSHQPESYLHRDVVVGDQAGVAVTKVMESCVRALVDASQHIADMPVEPVVEVMANSRQLIFCGLGASGHVARDAHHKFFRLGIPTTIATDPQTILQYAAIARPDDTFIVISHTGRWPDMLTAMEEARARGAVVIALTAPGSPIALAATWLLASHTREDTSHFTPMSSRLVNLTLLDGLQVALALRLGPPAEERLRQTKTILAGAESGEMATQHNGGN